MYNLLFKSKCNIFNKLPHGIILVDKHNIIKYINKYIVDLFKSELLNTNIHLLNLSENIFLNVKYTTITINFKTYSLISIHSKNNEIEEHMKTGTLQFNKLTNKIVHSKGIEYIYENTITNIYNYMFLEDKYIFEDYLKSLKDFDMVYRIRLDKIKFLKCICKVSGDYIQCYIQDITIQHQINLNLIIEKNKSERESEIKSSFVANISHEIRTPINGIIGMINILNDTELSLEQKKSVYIIIESSGLLLSIINNVLDFSKIESGKMDIEYIDTDLPLLLNNLKITFSSLITDNIKINLQIDPDIPKIIISDPIKLRQILSNLLNNAIKFTEYGSITCNVILKEEFIVFEIKDTGIGIPEESLNTLFQPFIQLDNSITRNYCGTGLGLSICKSLVELFKGEINIRSSFGIGTLVYFKIPLITKVNTEIPIKIQKRISDNNNSNNKLIVIVEDNITNQIVTKKTLEKLKYTNYVIYNNGKKLIESIDLLENIGLILMDIHMPFMDGYKCTKVLRSNNITCPIIALTANAMSGEKEKCIEIGMNDFILKPLQLDNFKSTIDKWIK